MPADPSVCHDADDAMSGAPFAASTGLNTPFQNETTDVHDNSVEHDEELAAVAAVTLIRRGRNPYCEPGDAFVIAPHCATNARQVLFHCDGDRPMGPGGNNQATVVAKEVSEVPHQPFVVASIHPDWIRASDIASFSRVHGAGVVASGCYSAQIPSLFSKFFRGCVVCVFKPEAAVLGSDSISFFRNFFEGVWCGSCSQRLLLGSDSISCPP